MKILQILNYFFLGLFLLLLASCSDEPISTESTTSAQEKDSYLKLGQKLENPYSVTNMKRALIIKGSQSWGEVKGKLRSQYPNTANLTDELLTNWQ